MMVMLVRFMYMNICVYIYICFFFVCVFLFLPPGQRVRNNTD